MGLPASGLSAGLQASPRYSLAGRKIPERSRVSTPSPATERNRGCNDGGTKIRVVTMVLCLVSLLHYLQSSPIELVQRERTLAGDNGARIARARRGTPFKPAQVRYMNGTRVSGDVWYVMWGGTDASPALELDSIGAALHSTQSYSLLPGGAMTGYKHDNRKARH